MKLVVKSNSYTVVSLDGNEEFEFADSHKASQKLEELGVQDDAIDEALKELALKRHDVAHFGIEGTFIFSEKT